MGKQEVHWVYDDGGREAAGFRGSAGDCFCRAVAIAGRSDYRETYDDIQQWLKARYPATFTSANRSHRNGVRGPDAKAYLAERGWRWVPTMRVGEGCRVHVRAGELPERGRLVLNMSKHFAAFVDGAVRDTHDPSREGTRCVYGYWIAPEAD